MNEEANEAVWAIVELMGHIRLAGRLTEEEKFGAKMGRLDIPADVACPNTGLAAHTMAPDACPRCAGKGTAPGFVTQLFGGGSVYRITVVTEEVARHVCKQTTPAPVSPWDFPKRLPSPEEPSRVYEDCGHAVEDCDCDPEDDDGDC